ncbi:MAG TPA: thioredoxin family protein [Bacillota bacterium]|nr:thioredoxin family protein [Bacillota bacterium]
MEIKVLGPGCANCNKLEKLVVEAVKELGIGDQVQKVTDIQEMLSYGVMSTPALVVDGKVKFSGRVPSKDEIKKYLQGGQGESSCGCNKGGCCC